MTVDLICIAILLFFGFLGLVRGFRSEVYGLTAIVLAGALGIPFGAAFVRGWASLYEWGSPRMVEWMVRLSLVAAALVWLAIALLGLLVNRAYRKGHAGQLRPPWVAYWGIAVGVLKAAVLCWLVLCFLAAFPQILPKPAARAANAWSIKTTYIFNPFRHWIRHQSEHQIELALNALWQLRREPQAWARLPQDDALKRVLANNTVRAAIAGPEDKLAMAAYSVSTESDLKDIDWREIEDAARILIPPAKDG